MNITRLQELAGITELSINKPKSKMDIINEIWDFENNLLYPLLNNKTLNELLKSFRYNNLIDYYTEQDSYEGEVLEKAIELTELYYNYIKPDDVYIVKHGSNPISGYKNIHKWITDDDFEQEIIFITKF